MFCTFLYYTFGVACNVSIKGFIQQICATDFYLKSNGKSLDFLAVWHKARAAAAACGTMAPKRAKVRFCIRSGPAWFHIHGQAYFTSCLDFVPVPLLGAWNIRLSEQIQSKARRKPASMRRRQQRGHGCSSGQIVQTILMCHLSSERLLGLSKEWNWWRGQLGILWCWLLVATGYLLIARLSLAFGWWFLLVVESCLGVRHTACKASALGPWCAFSG